MLPDGRWSLTGDPPSPAEQGLSPLRAAVQEVGGRASPLRSLLAKPKSTNAVAATWGITPREAVVTKDPSWPRAPQAQAHSVPHGLPGALPWAPSPAWPTGATGWTDRPQLTPQAHDSPAVVPPTPRDKGALLEGLLFQGLPRWGHRALGAACRRTQASGSFPRWPVPPKCSDPGGPRSPFHSRAAV